MDGTVKEDERPTSNIQRPTSNEKTNWEARRPESWEAGKQGAWGKTWRSIFGLRHWEKCH